MKYFIFDEFANIGTSLPVWGAWIEMRSARWTRWRSRSLPVWGAWIEIVKTDAPEIPAGSLPVWGAWIEIACRSDMQNLHFVAPRMGSVD